MGGSLAAPITFFASSEAYGHCDNSAFFCASFMANAMHVATPHSPQLVLGSNLNISIPVSFLAIANSFSSYQ